MSGVTSKTPYMKQDTQQRLSHRTLLFSRLYELCATIIPRLVLSWTNVSWNRHSAQSGLSEEAPFYKRIQLLVRPIRFPDVVKDPAGNPVKPVLPVLFHDPNRFWSPAKESRQPLTQYLEVAWEVLQQANNRIVPLNVGFGFPQSFLAATSAIIVPSTKELGHHVTLTAPVLQLEASFECVVLVSGLPKRPHAFGWSDLTAHVVIVWHDSSNWLAHLTDVRVSLRYVHFVPEVEVTNECHARSVLQLFLDRALDQVWITVTLSTLIPILCSAWETSRCIWCAFVQGVGGVLCCSTAGKGNVMQWLPNYNWIPLCARN